MYNQRKAYIFTPAVFARMKKNPWLYSMKGYKKKWMKILPACYFSKQKKYQ